MTKVGIKEQRYEVLMKNGKDFMKKSFNTDS